MQYNNDFFGEAIATLTRSPYFQEYQEDRPTPPPEQFILLDDSDDFLIDDSGEFFIA